MTVTTVQLTEKKCALCHIIGKGIEQYWMPRLREECSTVTPEGFDCELQAQLTWVMHDRGRGMDRSHETKRKFTGMDRLCIRVWADSGWEAEHLPIKSAMLNDFIILLAKLASAPPLQYSARRLKVGQVDFDRLREWVFLCSEGHGLECESPNWMPTTKVSLHLRLVDIHERAVLEIKEGLTPK